MKTCVFIKVQEVKIRPSKLFILICFFLPVKLLSQPVLYSIDSIPIVNNEVLFTVDYELDLTKHEFHTRAFRYLNNELDPYTGVFLINNEDSIVCEITDYLLMGSNFAYVFAMYMTYTLKFKFVDGLARLSIGDITYIEKGYFEAQENSERELDIPEYSARDILIDKAYSTFTIRRASDKITEETIKRVNEIVKFLEFSFIR